MSFIYYIFTKFLQRYRREESESSDEEEYVPYIPLKERKKLMVSIMFQRKHYYTFALNAWLVFLCSNLLSVTNSGRSFPTSKLSPNSDDYFDGFLQTAPKFKNRFHY